MSTEDNNDLQLGGSGEIISSTNACTSCEQNDVDNITKGITSMTVLNDMTKCSNCDKEGNSEKMNTCNKCNMAKYCNAACKKKHRKKHKKACEKRVAELHEEALFKEIEPEECPICMITLPHNVSQTEFKSCCGKYICLGCKHAINISEGKDICAFCRTPPPTYNDEDIKRVKNLISKGNANAFFRLGGFYGSGGRGLPQDLQKANKLFVKAGELGCAAAYFNLGLSYQVGRGVEMDLKKSKHYYELAAMSGYIDARHNLGNMEWNEAGNHQRAMKHYLISARAGYDLSLDMVRDGFKCGLITKDEYANTLRSYQQRQNEINSDERVNAAIFYASR